MKPYYQDERAGIVLYCGDCREVLPALAAGSVDLVLTDPPYGETSLKWDAPVPEWPSLVRPLLAPSGSAWCFGSLRAFMDRASDFAGWRLAQDLIWEKHNGSSLHADRFKRVHECIAQFYPADVPWEQVWKAPQTTPDATARTVRNKNRPPHMGERGMAGKPYASADGGPRLMRSVLFAHSCHGTAVHPTQKPLAVVTPPLLYSCPPGGLVLDPFAGSGTTLDAARREGRRAIGIEGREDYAEQAAMRLSQQVLPLELVA